MTAPMISGASSSASSAPRMESTTPLSPRSAITASERDPPTKKTGTGTRRATSP